MTSDVGALMMREWKHFILYCSASLYRFSVVFNEIENNLEELTDDEDGNEKAEFSWVTDILSKFDQQTW